MRTVRRDLPYDWFVADSKSHDTIEKVKVTSCDLGKGRPLDRLEIPRYCFFLSFPFLSLNLLTVKRRKVRTDACSWSVQFNGQKPDMLHVIESP
jgi:hypothetical protein